MRVLTAMSGGVDSSVVALMLQQQGHDVVGVFMRNGVAGKSAQEKSCCSASDARDASVVADRLGVPFYAVDYEQEFGKLMDHFAAEYRAGRTPNPCVLCNQHLKFGHLFELAEDVGAEAVATGHYARAYDGELHTAEGQLARLRGVLAERDAEQARRVAAAQARADEALRPMPKGVRDCLGALHACLREEGFTAQRFLRATAVDAEGLHDVEMLESSQDGLAVTFFTARRMTAALDRASGRLELRFFDGVRSADGERAALPEDGFAIEFHDVDGRAFEARLPYLVVAEGAYPVAPAEPERRPGLLDPGSRRSWAARLSKLLERSGTELRWSATRLRGQLDGRFLEVELVGTNEKGLVLASAHCDRVAVEIDERRDVVSLLLVDGVLRIEDVESTIDERGFRMLLPGLTPKDVTDAMMGLVIKR